MASQLQDAYEGKVSDYRYPSYFDAVVNEAIEKYNLTEEEIVNNGYRIYTELDQNYQANMQVIYENTGLFPTAEDGTHAESGSVALEPKTGGVRGVVGRVLEMIKLVSVISTMQLNQKEVQVQRLNH